MLTTQMSSNRSCALCLENARIRPIRQGFQQKTKKCSQTCKMAMKWPLNRVNREKQMESSPKTRYTLIEKIKDPQAAEAWAEFATIYQPLIFKICRKKGMQHADATDVTQEVLTRVSHAIENFRYDQKGATFRGWLYRITRNLVIDFFRQQQRNLLANAEPDRESQIEVEPSEEEALEFQTEYRRQVFATVANTVQQKVKPDTWAAFWMTEFENRNVDEVSQELQMTPGAIYVARSRVIAKLRNEVQKRMNETDPYFA